MSTFYGAFADDITIIASDKLTNDSTHKLNSNLQALSNYLKNKKLVMNQDKTFIMQFHPVGKKYTSIVLFKRNKKSIQQITSHKYVINITKTEILSDSFNYLGLQQINT